MTNRPRILLTRRWTHEVEQHLAEHFDVTLNEHDVPMDPDALRAAMREYDALCPTVTDRIDAGVLGAEAPMATPADGGETGGILSAGLVDDFVWFIEPGPQTITFGDAAADVFEQVEDCSSFAFDVEIEPVEGKAVFVAFYGPSDNVQATVYYEE